MKKLMLFFLLACQSLFSLHLKDKLSSGSPGDFIVYRENSLYHFLAVHSINKSCVTLEEISIPSYAAKQISSWKQWAEQGGKGHTSWIIFEIDLVQNEMTECFSYTDDMWLDSNSEESFLVNLLKLEATHLKNAERKKIGPKPSQGSMDTRKVWNPRFFHEGKKSPQNFHVYKSVWPNDGSVLSNKWFELYYPTNCTCPFPYWIQVTDQSEAKYQLKGVDTGHEYKSVHIKIPRRYPRFVKQLETSNNYELKLSTPIYYQSYSIYAQKLSDTYTTPIPIAHNINYDKASETLSIIISKETLKLLSKGSKYKWIVQSEDDPNIFLQSPLCFCWK